MRTRTMIVCACTFAAWLMAMAPIGCEQAQGVAPTPKPPIAHTTPLTGHTAMAAAAGSGRTMSASGHDITPLTDTQKATLVAQLTPEQIRITQKAGTERPFCGTLLDNKRDGAYHCVVCNLPIFSSNAKFHSGTGWPSFHQPVDPQHITRVQDTSLGTLRTEISCARCDAHLGHVFPDGPPPTGERHCLNSEALAFRDAPAAEEATSTETAYFAGGCFWGIEHYFQQGEGVLEAQSGYMNGQVDDPDYRDVCAGTTGHAEAVRVVYDPSVISYERLLQAFFDMHDPTQVNRQGLDVGTQYRSGLFTVNEAQATQARAFVDQLNAAQRFAKPIATQIEPAETFYLAEDYHQDYIAKTGRACHVTDPWSKDTPAPH